MKIADERAHVLLEEFSAHYPEWRHGQANEHLTWIKSAGRLRAEAVERFFNAWRPLSRHQPQILLLLASGFPDHAERKLIILRNYLEEDGIAEGHDPHYTLLDELITKLGGTPAIVKRSEGIMDEFHQGLWRPTTPARAAGLLAGTENPAMDISAFFHEVVRRSGFSELLDTGLYLKIHVVVEPIHIVDTHETALRHMAQGTQQREEVLTAFKEVMQFWTAFWSAAFIDLKQMQEAAIENGLRPRSKWAVQTRLLNRLRLERRIARSKPPNQCFPSGDRRA
jgi:hypothetical protein